ncbi:MAG: hypothetical protein ACE14S_08090 [Candidatus Bathyarchaeia archaeon]
MTVRVKIDSEGRLQLPKKVRKQLGDTVVLKETPEGYLMLPEKTFVVEEFKKLINSEPRRTGKPEFWSPQEMKAIWKKKV